MGRTVEADELQTVLTKVDRQVSQFKGRMLKGKVGGGGEVRTRRLHHDESDTSAAGGTGTGGGAVFSWCMFGTLGLITTNSGVFR